MLQRASHANAARSAARIARMNRYYGVVLPSCKNGLKLSAQDWAMLENTIREFVEWNSNDDATLGEVGGLLFKQRGRVAFASEDRT